MNRPASAQPSGVFGSFIEGSVVTAGVAVHLGCSWRSVHSDVGAEVELVEVVSSAGTETGVSSSGTGAGVSLQVAWFKDGCPSDQISFHILDRWWSSSCSFLEEFSVRADGCSPDLLSLGSLSGGCPALQTLSHRMGNG